LIFQKILLKYLKKNLNILFFRSCVIRGTKPIILFTHLAKATRPSFRGSGTTWCCFCNIQWALSEVVATWFLPINRPPDLKKKKCTVLLGITAEDQGQIPTEAFLEFYTLPCPY
jgi:hypothetical protein